jgi:hypothetical protein
MSEEENTNPGNNITHIHKEFITDTSERLSFTEQRLYNIESSLNHITQVDFPVINRKMDRLLDGMRELLNKPIKKIGVFRRFWAWLL